MNKTILLVGCLFLAGMSHGSESQPVSAVNVLNLGTSSSIVWVNGVRKSIAINAALSSPCLPGEQVEIQVADEVIYLNCGKTLEVK